MAIDAAQIGDYEIHAGLSEGAALQHPAVTLDDGRPDGALSSDGQIFGTYLHGLFDGLDSCSAMLRWMGIRNPDRVDYPSLREQSIDRLADALENGEGSRVEALMREHVNPVKESLNLPDLQGAHQSSSAALSLVR